jgi:hypothetical protein
LLTPGRLRCVPPEEGSPRVVRMLASVRAKIDLEVRLKRW